KDPRNRYASAGLLADDLDRFRAGEPLRARAVGMVERGWRWCRRKPALAAMLALVVFLGVGGAGGWYAWQDAESRRKSEIADETPRRGPSPRAGCETGARRGPPTHAVCRALDQGRPRRRRQARPKQSPPNGARCLEARRELSRGQQIASLRHGAPSRNVHPCQ